MTNKMSIPYSQEAEEALLGAVLTSANAYAAASDCITPMSFFLLRHRWIWQAIGHILGRGLEYDLLIVGEELRAMGKLEEVGGQAYLIYLISSVPTSIHADVYARLVERAYIRRRLLQASSLLRRSILRYVDPICRYA
jgi:replicative DNA helicase